MSITNFNNVTFDFKAGEDFVYRDLEEIFQSEDEIIKVNALYINDNSKFGESAVALTDNYYINLPKHLVDVVKDIRNDDKIVQDINDGKVGFTIYSYEQKQYKKTCYSINWIEI